MKNNNLYNCKYHKYSLTKHLLFWITVTTISSFSCRKLVEVDAPITSTNAAVVFSSDATAASSLTGIYDYISSQSFYQTAGLLSLSYFPSLSSDELTYYNVGIADLNTLMYYTNSLSSQTLSSNDDYWSQIYPFVYQANAAIEGLNNSTALTPKVKSQLLGEAKFIRAFCYFYLTNLYGDVPLALTTDYKVNQALARSDQDDVYKQIITDLKDAEELMDDTYYDASITKPYDFRVRPNKWVAIALLARVYLYTKDYPDADAEATAIINNNALYKLDSLNNVFLAKSAEAIWQLQPVGYGINTRDAATFILPASGPGTAYPVYLSNYLLNSFENGDLRRKQWIDSVIAGGTTYYFPYKYKVNTPNAPVTEYEMVFRLTEQYLIRAEAKANEGSIDEGMKDINVIRERAGLRDTSASSLAAAMQIIMHERQVELFTEWGNRWLDLKRSGMADTLMPSITAAKGGTWKTGYKLYPIILGELQKEPSLTQNPDY